MMFCLAAFTLATVLCPLSYGRDTGFSSSQVDFRGRALLLIDAGSSHTAFDLYQMTNTYRVRGLGNCRADEPGRFKGIEQFGNNPTGVGDYLRQVILIDSSFTSFKHHRGMFKEFATL